MRLGLTACAILLGSASSAQVTQRVSVDSAGAQADHFSTGCSVSADGRFVTFESQATNLVPGDTNGLPDVFVHDRLTGATQRVSVDAAGVQGNASSLSPSISADGRYVAFTSEAQNLVPGDTNGWDDVFVHDRNTGSIERVSVDSSGVEGDFFSYAPALSADGRYVAFNSDASNLVAGDTNGKTDVFLRDRQSGTTQRLSVHSSGAQSNNHSYDPSVSADGRFVAFFSQASNLIAGDTNGNGDVYLRDLQNGTTERVSLTSAGTQGNNLSYWPSISADGRYVAFRSFAWNLVPGDTNATGDVFVRDRQSGTTESVSVDANGAQAIGGGEAPSISADGRYVAFVSLANNLVTADTNGYYDAFVRDRLSGTTELVSVDSSAAQGDHNTYAAEISADARFVAFLSAATNLVPADTNAFNDVFVHDREPTGFQSFCDPSIAGVIACPCANPPAAAGRGCDNSGATGGAILSVSGVAYLAMDTLVFATQYEMPTATSALLQGDAQIATGMTFGQGIRCAGGVLLRMYVKVASSGSITAPEFAAGDPSVSTRSAALGDVIQPGEIRTYLVYYRDPVVLGGCPSSSTFNATQSGRVAWSP